MENNLLFALQISGIGIVVLLLVLAALAGVVYLMTRFIVDKEETEEGAEESAPAAEAAAIEEPKTDLKLAAAIAVAIARAQAEMQVVSTEAEGGELNAWRQFGLQRRLTQPSTFRRTR